MIGIESAGRGVLPDGLPWMLRRVRRAALLARGAALPARARTRPSTFRCSSIPTFHAATIAGSLFRAGAGALPFLVPLTLAGGLRLQRDGERPHHVRERARLVLHAADDVARAAPLLRAHRVVRGERRRSRSCSRSARRCRRRGPPPRSSCCCCSAASAARSRFATMGALAFADVPRPKLAAATSFQGTAQQLMKAVGVTVAAGHDPGHDAAFRQRARRALATRVRVSRDGRRRARLMADVRATLAGSGRGHLGFGTQGRESDRSALARACRAPAPNGANDISHQAP